MDRSSDVTLGGMLAGGMVGFGLGWIACWIKRAWTDHTGIKSAAAVVGKTKWRVTRQTIGLGFLLVTVGAWVLGTYAAR